MPRRRDATWAEWGPPPGVYRTNPPEYEVTLQRRDRNGLVWFRRVTLKDWVTVSEAANILGVNPATAWLWTKKGNYLPTKKRRGHQFVRFSHVVKLAEERGTAPPLTKGKFLAN